MKNGRRKVNGILLLNKALKVSSNTALQQVKRLYSAQKAGHTGSLDPLATGVLPICFGEATKFSQYLLDADKVYTVWGRLGCTTMTGDAEGEINVIANAPNIDETTFDVALKTFLGNIEQIPPMYSALKKDGVPLYQLARQGQEIERKTRVITIHNIQLNHYAFPDFQITVHCSKGTYIRTLVEDIGKSLHSGAYLLNLRRDKAGPYTLEKSFTKEQLEAYSTQASLDALLLPVDTAVLHYPLLQLDDNQSRMLQQGKTIIMSNPFLSDHIVRLYNVENAFLGLGKMALTGELRAHRLMAPARNLAFDS